MEQYYLAHHGIKGQKWGVRRFQNQDGSLTSAGKQRYGQADKGFARDFRTWQVQRVGASWDKENARTNRRLQKKVDQSNNRLAVAKVKGASSKKIERLKRKRDEAKLRADFIADVNERYKKVNVNYAKKSFARRMITNYDRQKADAYRETYNAMAKKYGEQRVENLVIKDTAVYAASVIVASIGYVSLSTMLDN